MTLDTGMYIAGVVSLVLMAALAIWTIGEAVLVDRGRILAALRGEPVTPAEAFASNHGVPLADLRALVAETNNG